MSKEDESEKRWKYNGNEDEWDIFDRRMLRYMRKKYDVFGERLWWGEIPMVSDEMDPYDFLDHCDDVMKAIETYDPSEARKLRKDRETFEDPEWQYNWMMRQLRLMSDYIESHAEGQAEIEMMNYDGDLRELRKHLYKQFGSGSGSNIHEKELDFDKGMPEKGKAAFPAGCDMGAKLRQLESRRLYFLRMAGSSEKRRTYTYCQETKLVRIVLEHVNKQEYGDCIHRVLEKVKTRKMIQGMIDGVDSDGDGLPSQHDRSFSDDWLPSWKLLKSALLDEWMMKTLEKGSSNSSGKAKGVLPVAMNGVKVVSCYGCGIEGHKKGDPVCKAGKFDVHASAPQDYKERMSKGKKRQDEKKKPPKSSGKPGAKEGGKEKKHCHAFAFGKGTCRFGAKCRYLHEKGDSEAKLVSFSPEQKKLVSTLLSSAMKRTASAIAKKNKQSKKKAKVEGGKKESDDDEDFSSILAACFLAPVKNLIKRDFTTKNGIVLATDLHSVHKNCGIDSDAGISISTMREDFANRKKPRSQLTAPRASMEVLLQLEVGGR
jgi:hypothetical protein